MQNLETRDALTDGAKIDGVEMDGAEINGAEPQADGPQTAYLEAPPQPQLLPLLEPPPQPQLPSGSEMKGKLAECTAETTTSGEASLQA